jgi:hypothetical protein
VLLAITLLTTLIWPTWIENVTGTDPDSGSGATEVAAIAVLATGLMVLGILSIRRCGTGRRERKANQIGATSAVAEPPS